MGLPFGFVKKVLESDVLPEMERFEFCKKVVKARAKGEGCLLSFGERKGVVVVEGGSRVKLWKSGQ